MGVREEIRGSGLQTSLKVLGSIIEKGSEKRKTSGTHRGCQVYTFYKIISVLYKISTLAILGYT
jgi:hypothetical protein